MEGEQVSCVASELRTALSDQQRSELVELDTAGWGEEDFLEHAALMDALAAAQFECMGASLGGG